ncbi:ATP-binding cassette domain-containing protein [Sulfurimonas sp. C5]|uniref:ATP-binding cassette domain-containing protein n=1 Tax=Sulfurimonas sp. C5 TaxID=3036947 RepID=UPI0024562108|nr:ATP-binding cassette domain-containing protein [Sulfurimonas sp. C5]MDH4944486.1 ATP-binding cassette domain-containing protein [Sulfurimonas sp. C5]
MKIKKLSIDYQDKKLVDISFEVNKSLALVGQSGSGKSLTLKALLELLPNGMQSKIEIDSDVKIGRSGDVALVVQNPFTALSPLTKIKKQFFAPKERIEQLFNELGLDLALLERFPPELSGGQLQRVVIAIAISQKPKLLLLDEPTTALDPQTRISIIELLKELQEKENFKMLFVTHDIASAQSLCEDICVIKLGKLVECGKMTNVVNNPQNEYTKTLIEANFANREYRK